jgi:IS1 family transposase
MVIRQLEAEADELWSFVQKKANTQWIWIAMDAKTRQIMAFYVGDRHRDSTKSLWAKIPLVYCEQATCHTDQDDASTGLMPAARHKAITQHARNTNHSEASGTPCGNASVVWSAQRCHAPRNWPSTSVPSRISSATTISRGAQHDLCSTTLCDDS